MIEKLHLVSIKTVLCNLVSYTIVPVSKKNPYCHFSTVYSV